MKKHRGRVSKMGIKKQLRLLPGHLIVGIWCLFTLVMLFWIVAASLSTSPEIMQGKALKFETGLHFENYVRAWSANSISVFFLNSLMYAICAMVGSILISAPAAYVLARFVFKGNLVIKSSFITAMSIPQIMVVLPLFSMATRVHLSGSKILLILLYIGMQIPYTTTFLLASFSNLSRVYEEAAAIDGCSPMKTFWKIMLPLAQPGIVTVGIFNFMNVWNEYFLSLIFASSEKNMSVGPGLKSVLTSMQYTGDWGGLFAAVVIVFLPTLLLFILLSKMIIGGITNGGVKG
mgnify:FL=1